MSSKRIKMHATAKKAAWEANEPGFNVMDYQSSLLKSLNFFNVEVENSEKKQWTINHWQAQGKKVNNLDKINDFYYAQLGVLVRVQQRGYDLEEKHMMLLERKYKEFFAQANAESKEVEVVKQAVVKKTADEKYSEQAKEIGAEVDAELDNICVNEKRVMNVKNLILGKSISQGACKLISESYKRQFEELQQALLAKDPDLKEAYSHLSKKTIRMMYDFLSEVISFADQTKRVAKPRKKKEKPAAVVAAKVQYLAEYPDLGLKSVHPSKIVGADTVYLFNTRLRKMFKYVSINGMTLTVKGTTLQNFDTSKSGSKTLRKPEVYFSPMSGWEDMTKRPFNKMFDEVKSVLAKAPGRISSDMIIVKVF